MAKLFIPNCEYCSAPCTPLGEKKLKKVKEEGTLIYCSKACEEKDTLLKEIECQWNCIKDPEIVKELKKLTKEYVELKYIANKTLSEERTVMLFSDHRFSFLMDVETKDHLNRSLTKYCADMYNKIEKVITSHRGTI